MNPQPQVAIVAGVRTPFVRAGTDLSRFDATSLGQHVAIEALQRTGVDPTRVDEVIFGNIGQPAEATNIARVIALRAGVPADRPAFTVQRNCASGMQAITSAAEHLESGRARIVVAGGTESMSRIPLQYPQTMSRWMGAMLRARSLSQRLAVLRRFRFAFLKPEIALEIGLTDGYAGINMGRTAEVLAREFGIGREEQDAYAFESHRRAVVARPRFESEIAPIPSHDLGRWLDADVGPREDIQLERLQRMRPYFDRRNGTVTIGNSCPITDGAAAVVMMSRQAVRDLGVRPLGWLRSWNYAGLEPERMGLGPAYATPGALRGAGVAWKDIELVELNEAFAAQVLANERAFAAGVRTPGVQPLDRIGELDRDKLNVNGGAIALGHPVGATGSRLVLTLLSEMRRRQKALGLATLCIGGGQGAALVLEGGDA